ncbi:Zinc transporter 10 [Halotydeus destructor]|nr:Zinc transporter 10 [Halotydeus destructor]
MKNLGMLRVYFLVCTCCLMFVTELATSQLTQSLILLVDAYRNLHSTLSLSLIIISQRLTNEKTLKNTFGWARVEILGGLFNGIFFAALCFSVIVSCVQHLAHSSHEDITPSSPLGLIVAGLVGLTVHTLIHFVLRDLKPKETGALRISGSDVIVSCVVGNNGARNQNSKAECFIEAAIGEPEVTDKLVATPGPVSVTRSLHFAREFSTSLLLILTGAAILIAPDTPVVMVLDPLMGIMAVFLLGATFYPNVMASGFILLQTIPKNINISSLKKDICEEFTDILSIHDLHVWDLTGSQAIATCHVVLPRLTSLQYVSFSTNLKTFLKGKGISLSTIQPEFVEHVHARSCSGSSCLYSCSLKNLECRELKCCHD